MALTDEVKTRVPNALLVELTNQGSRSATTIDATVLTAAAADAEAEFCVEVGVKFDVTIPSHVAVAVPGVLYYLHTYSGIESARQRELEARWRSGLAKLSNAIGSTKRVRPRTSPNISRSTQPINSRPDFDRTRWDRYVLDSPGSSDEE